jgi:hypothetical protein
MKNIILSQLRILCRCVNKTKIILEKVSRKFFLQEGDWFGEKLFHNTVYFVNPDLICNGGRTAEEFEKCGTMDRLWVQLGNFGQTLGTARYLRTGFGYSWVTTLFVNC